MCVTVVLGLFRNPFVTAGPHHSYIRSFSSEPPGLGLGVVGPATIGYMDGRKKKMMMKL